jgi:hypothetical protein
MNSKQDSILRGFRCTQYLAHEERCRLLYGPYEPPLVKRGFLVDAIRGKVRFSRFTNTPIPWPKFQNQSKGGSGGIVLCGDLIRALTDESGPAVAYHWGVCQGTVRTWRRALELKGRNAGSHRLIEKGVALARRPESQAKHSAAMRAKALSPTHRSHLFAAIKVWRKERFEARRNVMGGPGDFRRRPNWTRGYRRKKNCLRNTRRPIWRPLSGEHPKVSRHGDFFWVFGNTGDVLQRGKELETKILGTDTDRVTAKRLDRSVSSVTHKRRALGIRCFSRQRGAGNEDR